MSHPCLSPHAYQLRFSWTAWPSGTDRFPPQLSGDALGELKLAWESDGLRALEWEWTAEKIRILFSTRPEVAPAFLCQRAKGRLQHALRQQGDPVSFSRKVSCSSVGNPHEKSVDAYLRQQLDGGDFADPKYREALAASAYTHPEVQVTAAQETHSGRYVFALHVVLVTANRLRLPSEKVKILGEALKGSSVEDGFLLGRVALMPDHIHLAVKGDPGKAPLELVEAIRIQTGKALGTQGLWMPTSYMGTYGEYGMGAIRKRLRGEE